jgi:hypothetical protein
MEAQSRADHMALIDRGKSGSLPRVRGTDEKYPRHHSTVGTQSRTGIAQPPAKRPARTANPEQAAMGFICCGLASEGNVLGDVPLSLVHSTY